MIKQWFQLVGFCALIFLLLSSTGLAQGAVQVQDERIESEFRDHITAYLTAQSTADIIQVEFFYSLAGVAATSRNVAEFNTGKSVEASFKIDQTDVYFPPGTEIEYWWKITDVEDNVLKTDRKTYVYMDNRHPFQTLSNERVQVYWYDGDNKFGQTLFDQANKALDQLQTNVGVKIEHPVKIFVYGSHSDLMDAIAVGADDWTGGQAFAEQGVVVMGISPYDLDWGLKATTHELTHLVIHQATDNPYSDLPRWLDEGLAVYNEDTAQLDDQFRYTFEEAVQSDTLMTLQTLSSSFPADSEAANLAYGESGAVVKFIVDTYGPETMKKLLDIFSEGALYDAALKEALGVDTDGLDNAWRASLKLPPLSAAETDSPAEATSPSAQTDAPTPPAQAAQPAQAATPGSSAPGLPCACLPGWLLPALAGLVLVKKYRRPAESRWQ